MSDSHSQLDASIEIVTPENIAFHYRVAGPFRRLPAYLMDLAIRVAIFFGILFLAGIVGSVAGGGMAGAIILLGLFVLEWFYGALFETLMNGQTPGKWMMGIRVLTVDGRPIHGLQAVLRNFLRAVDMFPVVSLEIFNVPAPLYLIPTFLVGLLVMACNRRFQRMGDLVSGTMVVIEERHWLTGVAKLEDPRVAQLAEYIPADFQVSRSLARTLATYVERRRFFTSPRRREVARHLADPLLERFGMRRDTSHDLLLCAIYYRTFIADRGDTDPLKLEGGESPFDLPFSESAPRPAAGLPTLSMPGRP